MSIERLFATRSLIPVVVVDDAADAVPVAQALLAGGIHAIEITLRTAAGLAAIEAVAHHVPQMLVGAGTVLNAAQLRDVAHAGARFAVSPGLTDGLIKAAHDSGMAWLPGVANASDIMRACDAGMSYLKFFPAGALGGVAMLSQLASVFRDVRFCPTGGVSLATMADYLALPSVFAIGGSWLTPAHLIAAKDWQSITHIARDSVAKI